MNLWSQVRSWVRANFGRSRMESEMDVELKFHIESFAEDLVRSGVPRPEAMRRARIEFGGIEQAKEECRDARGVTLLASLAQDLRYGLRMVRRSPGFTLIAVLTIALGVGATTAIFSVVDATLLHPLPFPQPEQLVSIQDDLPGVGARDVGMSEPEMRDLERSGVFEHVSPVWFDENNLTGSSQPVRVRLVTVAPNYFALLGAKPKLGRTFDPADSTPGYNLEVVISDGLWQRDFGGDAHVLDKSVRLDTDLYRIIGVMPPAFRPPGKSPKERDIEVWAAMGFAGAPFTGMGHRDSHFWGTIARLKPGLTIAAAQSRVDALVAALQKEYPSDYPPQSAWTVRLLPLKETVVGKVRQSLVLLFGAVGLVLLIGCVNVANLLLARASARGREMAIRQALGAARARLARQLLTESLLLSLLGGVAGLATLLAMKGLLLRLVPESLPRLTEISISWPVLLFALAASIFAGAIFGLAPAWHAGRSDLTHALKEAARGATASGAQARTRRVLVIAEFALSLVLMVAAGLMLRSFWDLLNAPLGFNPESVMTVRTRLPYPNVRQNEMYGTPALKARFVREVHHRLAALPGVSEVALGDTASIPLDPSQRELKLISEGHFLFTIESCDNLAGSPASAERTSITPDYFRVLGIPLLRGRAFNDFDTEETPPVAIVDQAFARTYWPDKNPLGKRFKSEKPNSQWTTVVGVVADARTDSLAEGGVPRIYLNLFQAGTKHLAIFLRGKFDAAAIPEVVRQQVRAVDPTLPVFDAQTLNETVSASLSERRFAMEILALFALTGLLLASLGIYGVISYSVSERAHEIGIRRALGAQRSSILQMVLRQGMGLAVAGAAIGLVCALIVSRLMAGLLYGVRPTDPLTFAGVAFLLIVVALFACYIPARRAIRVDPMVALRYE